MIVALNLVLSRNFNSVTITLSAPPWVKVGMIKNTFLGLGPMSLELINSLDFFSRKYISNQFMYLIH